MRSTLQAEDTHRWIITIWFASLALCRKRQLQWIKNGKSSKWFQPGNWSKFAARQRLYWRHKESKRKVHCASLIDLCHMKNAELEQKLQQHKGRVVLRGDIVKDDSGAYVVWTEQGSSASQMTAAKIMDVIAKLPDCEGQAANAVTAYKQVKLDDAPRLLKFRSQNVQTYGYAFQDTNGRNHGPEWKNQLFLERDFVRTSFGRNVAGTAIWRNFVQTWMGKSTELGMSSCSRETKYSDRKMLTT